MMVEISSPIDAAAAYVAAPALIALIVHPARSYTSFGYLACQEQWLMPDGNTYFCFLYCIHRMGTAAWHARAAERQGKAGGVTARSSPAGYFDSPYPPTMRGMHNSVACGCCRRARQRGSSVGAHGVVAAGLELAPGD